MLKKILVLVAMLSLVPLSASAATPVSVVGTPPDVVIGSFDAKHVKGSSMFVQDGENVTVVGKYRKLKDNRSFFTVIYGNRDCDPAQAVPFGPFRSDTHGRAIFVANASLMGVDLGKTGSVSVRRGDNSTDIDKDGKTGPTDVVAVPGKPKIGLIRCDTRPLAFNG